MTPFTPRRHEFHPSFIDGGYKSTALRGPKKPAISLPADAGTVSGPLFGKAFLGPEDADLTRNGRVNGEPLGERIVVAGRVLDEMGRPLRNTIVEVWQCNAAGRYIHKRDQHDAPIDPNFRGSGRCVTDDDGRYSFLTVKPGAYPWKNHHNAWRPNHIHFSLFGQGCAARLVTQMYFPGDPLLAYDPIFLSTPEIARERLISAFDLSVTSPEWALGYTFDIVLRGRDATPFEE
ncbi:MAG TPA: protocatechuate 3,4-dioxygenase subunit beta [Methylomirabilota bacterium]|nr:protocatechuate 3,4-dioxygenase subunit beta [Methylomirabilota bacterium]